jgi:hypothetical protein
MRGGGHDAGGEPHDCTHRFGHGRGAQRLRNLLSVVASKLGAGRSTWRETLFDRETGQQASSSRLEPAE